MAFCAATGSTADDIGVLVLFLSTLMNSPHSAVSHKRIVSRGDQFEPCAIAVLYCGMCYGSAKRCDDFELRLNRQELDHQQRPATKKPNAKATLSYLYSNTLPSNSTVPRLNPHFEMSKTTCMTLSFFILLVTTAPSQEKSLTSSTIKLNADLAVTSGPGWKSMTETDFTRVNSADDTWSFEKGMIRCTGRPVSVIRSKKQYTNFELVCEWRHLKKAGNSGIFIWTIPESLERLKGPGLPQGVEVQVLDLGYKEAYEQGGKRVADWFTCHGDVFPVGNVKMKPFPPVAPNGKRSFPTKNLSLGVNQWNSYYVRAINGEVRLWVNGEEVSGGTDISPRTGYLCLESEGSPIDFRGLKIRILP